MEARLPGPRMLTHSHRMTLQFDSYTRSREVTTRGPYRNLSRMTWGRVLRGSQEVELVQASAHGGVHKQDVVSAREGILLSHEN